MLPTQFAQQPQRRAVTWEETHKPILPNTPEMEAFLGIGYGGLTVEDARATIAAAEKKRLAVAPEDYKKARAFMEAYTTAPKVVATRAAIVPKPLD